MLKIWIVFLASTLRVSSQPAPVLHPVPVLRPTAVYPHPRTRPVDEYINNMMGIFELEESRKALEYASRTQEGSHVSASWNMGLRYNSQMEAILTLNKYDKRLYAEHHHIQIALLLVGRLADQQRYSQLVNRHYNYMVHINCALTNNNWTPAHSNSTLFNMIIHRDMAGGEMRKIRESLGPLILGIEYHPTANNIRQRVRHSVAGSNITRHHPIMGSIRSNSTDSPYPPVIAEASFFYPYIPMSFVQSSTATATNDTLAISDELGRVLASFFESLATNFIPAESLEPGETSMVEFIAGVRESMRLQRELVALTDAHYSAWNQVQQLITASYARGLEAGPLALQLSVLQHRAEYVTQQLNLAIEYLSGHTTMMANLGSFDLFRIRFGQEIVSPSSVASSSPRSSPSPLLVADLTSATFLTPSRTGGKPATAPPSSPNTYDSELEEESREGEDSDDEEDAIVAAEIAEMTARGRLPMEDDDADDDAEKGYNSADEEESREGEDSDSDDEPVRFVEEIAPEDDDASSIVSTNERRNVGRALGKKASTKQSGGEPESKKRRMD